MARPLTLSSPNLPPPCSHYQALEVIRELSKTIPIERAHMRVRLVCDKKVGKELKAKVAPLLAKIEEEDWGASYDLVSCWAPSAFDAFLISCVLSLLLSFFCSFFLSILAEIVENLDGLCFDMLSDMLFSSLLDFCACVACRWLVLLFP